MTTTTTHTGIGSPRTMAELRRRLEDSALTLARLPLGRSSHAPAGFRVAWPDYARDAKESYGYHRAGVGRVVASASEIGRMEEALGWMGRWWSNDSLHASGLPRDAGIVAFERCALHLPWPKIKAGRLARWTGMPAIPGGNSTPSLRALERRALEVLLLGLGGDPRVGEPDPDAPPPVTLEVVLDFAAQDRVRLIRGEAVSLVSHARAEHRLVPARRRE